VVVVIQERQHRQTQRDHRMRSRRWNSWNSAYQVVEQDKQKDARHERLILLVAVADDLLGLVADGAVDHLGHLLRGIWALDRQRRPHDEEKENQAERDQQLEREWVVDRCRRRRLNPYRMLQRRDRAAE